MLRALRRAARMNSQYQKECAASLVAATAQMERRRSETVMQRERKAMDAHFKSALRRHERSLGAERLLTSSLR